MHDTHVQRAQNNVLRCTRPTSALDIAGAMPRRWTSPTPSPPSQLAHFALAACEGAQRVQKAAGSNQATTLNALDGCCLGACCLFSAREAAPAFVRVSADACPCTSVASRVCSYVHVANRPCPPPVRRGALVAEHSMQHNATRDHDVQHSSAARMRHCQVRFGDA